MSTAAIVHYLSGLGKYSGNWKLYYDFQNYSGNYILNSRPDESGYSGYVSGDMATFTGTSSGSGYFNDSYIEITSGNALFPPDKSFTFLFSQEKINNGCGTLFSNYKGNFTPTSGWEFAINNANKAYFYNYDNWEPNVSTLNNTPAAKNYYAFTSQYGKIQCGRYVPENDSWETHETNLNSNYFLNNTGWFLGSGEYNYTGYMDKVLYFNTKLPLNVAAKVLKATCQEVATGIGHKYLYTSGLSGYSGFATGTTGVVFTTGVLSGYYTGGTGSGTYVTGSTLTGELQSGDIYYEFINYVTGQSGSGIPPQVYKMYSGLTWNAAATTVGNYITGFTTGFSGFVGSGTTVPVFQPSGVTGVLQTGSGYSPVYWPPSGYLISGGRTILSGNCDNDYLYNTISYIGQREDAGGSDGVEFIYTPDRESINLKALYGYLKTFKGNGFYIPQTGLTRVNPDQVTLVSNGVTQLSGAPYFSLVNPEGGGIDPFATQVSTVSGNFFFSGNQISTGMMGTNDVVIYDNHQSGVRARLDITGLSDYESSPFSQIPMEGEQVFFNGQKIYSGIDYIDDGGFIPTGVITGMSGIYFTTPSFTGAEVSTGINLYDLTGDGFKRNTHVVYLNGIRQPNAMLLQYCTGVSLLQTGKNILEVGVPFLYNLSTENFVR